MKADKRTGLKQAYYQSFFALIVVPILTVILVSVGIIRATLSESSVDRIRQAQDNLASTLGKEVKDVSLRLSHFVYVNNNEIVRTAVKTDTHNFSERYHYTGVLTEAFNYAMVPVQDIISAVFYMKDGTSTCLKDDMILGDREIRSSEWYQQALADPNMVKIGYYDIGIVASGRKAHTFTIVAALAPGREVDRDGAIEMVSLFVSSDVEKLMKKYNQAPFLGTTLLVDSQGRVLLDSDNGQKLLPQTEDFGWLEQGQSWQRVDGKRYAYIVTVEPVTGCRFVSIVPARVLSRNFSLAAAAVLAVTVILFFLFYRFSSYFLKNIIGPVHEVVVGMKQVEEGGLEVHVTPEGQEELQTMVHSFNHMVRQLRTLIRENEEHQKKKLEAEIRALQSQINPHFLVNSLSSIRFIAQVSHYESIGRMAEALMKILSCSFRSNAGFYSFGEELEVLDGFIYLMKIRHSDGFEIFYEIEEGCRDLRVPRLILQPIVENSIVHGFAELEDEIGHIWLRARRQEGFLVIEVEDDGQGMTEEEIRRILTDEETATEQAQTAQGRKSIGVSNVNSRLILNFGESSRMVIESEPGRYTRTILRIPSGQGGTAPGRRAEKDRMREDRMQKEMEQEAGT